MDYTDEYWTKRLGPEVPAKVQAAIKRVYSSYPADCMPQGICDPMYIMNTIALELGIGDGKGNFNLKKGGIMKDKLQTFADRIRNDTVDVIQKRHPGLNAEHEARVTIMPGKKYTKVDVGRSGKYMVVIATGEIFGIKGYGVIHRGKRYGSLDTINDYFWGEYAPIKKLETITVEDVGSFEEEVGI